MTLKLKLAVAVAALFAASTAVPAADRAGEATRSQQNAFQWASISPDLLATGDEVYQKAEVYTKDHGSVEMRMDDDSLLTLGPNSQLVIDEFVYSSGADTGNATLSLGRGVLRMVSGRIGSGRVRIGTPVATIGIRGTDFILDTNRPGNLRVWSKSGTVTVSPSNSDIVFELVAPSFASCSSASCEIGPSPAEPSFFPIAPANPSSIGGENDPGGPEGEESESSGGFE
ncbi:MAG: FecR domain-containing protein [Paracoccaceae bacterium]